jgi:hypothetical protein
MFVGKNRISSVSVPEYRATPIRYSDILTFTHIFSYSRPIQHHAYRLETRPAIRHRLALPLLPPGLPRMGRAVAATTTTGSGTATNGSPATANSADGASTPP